MIEPVGGVVDGSSDALDALAAEDLAPLFGPALLERPRLRGADLRRPRPLACDGAVTRIVLGPDGTPLDHGRTHRLVPAHLRRAVEVRDQGRVFTGCQAPTAWCDVHRVPAWIDGGDTSLANSALLCERHRTEVHHGFRVERRPDGRWHTWRPDGTRIPTGPGSTGPPLTTAA